MKKTALLSALLLSLGYTAIAGAQLIPTSSPLFNREIRCKGGTEVTDQYSGVRIPLELGLSAKDGNPNVRHLFARILGGGGSESVNTAMIQDALHSVESYASISIETVSYSTDDRRVQLVAKRDPGSPWRFTAIIDSVRYGLIQTEMNCAVL